MKPPAVSRRRALRAAVAGAAVFPPTAWWLTRGNGSAYPKAPVTLATGVHTGVYEKYGKLLKRDLARDMPGVEVRLANTQGSVDNVDRLVSGEADFAIAAADAVADHRKDGDGSLRACARLYDDYMQLVVPAGSPVTSVRDLGGRRVGVGQPGSGVNLITGRLLRAGGLDMSRDLTAVEKGIDRMPGMLGRGELDAFFWSGGLPTAAITDLSDAFGVELVQLGDLTEALRSMGDITGYYRQAVMPADAYENMRGGRPVKTIAVANLLVTTDRADPVLVERFTRTVIDSRDRIGERVHAAQLVDLRTAVFTDPLPLHEGARNYYRSVKP